MTTASARSSKTEEDTAGLAFDPIAEAGRQWAERWGDEHVPAMMAVTSIMRVQQLVLARLNDALEPFGLSFARYEALMLLSYTRNGELPLGKMGTRLQVHPTSVTNLVDGLERLGHVTRVAHPTDRRTTLARITPLGRDVAAQATAALHAMRFGLNGLADEDLEAVTATFTELREQAGDF